MILDTDRRDFVEHATGEAGGAEDGNERPVVVRVAASLDVEIEPLAAYATLSGYRNEIDEASTSADGGYSFLLESAEKVASSDPAGAFAPTANAETEHARYSFVGYDPAAVVTVNGGEVDTEVLDERYAAFVETNRIDEDDRGRSKGETERTDTLDRLRSVLSGVRLAGFPETDRQLLDGGLVGFLAYDAVYDLHLREVGVGRPKSSVPDAQFVLAAKTVVFDHAPELGGEDGPTVSLVFTPLVRPSDDPGKIYDEIRAEAERVEEALSSADPIETGGFRRAYEESGPREEYEQVVTELKERILDGEIYQAVPSRTRELYGDVDSIGLYAALRVINPSPYMYLLRQGERTIVGASPETLLSVRGTEIVSNPIAGTCSRGASPVEDRRLAGELLADGKERAEHTMLVDLARNDVRRVSQSGSVAVTEFMNVLKYSHVQHIESTVTGSLARSADAFDAMRAAFPAGTLSGAPKIRAMELIDRLESAPRGVYGGGVGYFSWTGNADMAIAIRTATIEHDVSLPADARNQQTNMDRLGSDSLDRITVQAGGGIVADSDPGAEYEETERKMNGVLAALRRIEESRTPAEAK